MLTGLEGPRVDACKAAVVAIQGQWGAAAEGFAAASKAMGALANARRGLLSTNHLRLYLLCLLAQPSPQAWTAARKLAVAESGSRKPPPSDWGLWAHAAAARLGDEAIDAGAFAHHAGWGGSPHRANADRLVLAAWLGHEPAKWGPAEVDAVVQHFESMGRTLWADLLRQAAARFGWAVPAHTRPGAPWGVAYFGGPRETWRDALAAIAALGEQKVAATADYAVDPTLLWQLSLDDDGRLIDIEPFERPASARSRALPKAVPLSRIKKSVRLDPRDAAVARCIEKSAHGGSTLGLDVVAAAMALVNHPGVTLDDDPGRPVELREALPEMEVRRVRQDGGAEAFEFHLLDPLGHSKDIDLGKRWAGSSWSDETERRNTLRVLRDGEDRARLIRITPAQRRVAELVGQRWAVPVDAKAELDAALRVLAGHFQLHSDAAAGQGVASDAWSPSWCRAVRPCSCVWWCGRSAASGRWCSQGMGARGCSPCTRGCSCPPSAPWTPSRRTWHKCWRRCPSWPMPTKATRPGCWTTPHRRCTRWSCCRGCQQWPAWTGRAASRCA
jgi:hypothetical protein